MAKNKEKFKDYDGFVEKFKPKKTTDDCYTPPEVYDVVLKHVREKYNIADDVPIVRPFYPGGDYEHYDYPEGWVVQHLRQVAVIPVLFLKALIASTSSTPKCAYTYTRTLYNI